MKHRMDRLFFIWQSAEEEKWLNNMAAKGLALTGVWLFRYEFEDSEPGEWVYRMELLRHTPEHPESRKHIAFMEETGAEMVTRKKTGSITGNGGQRGNLRSIRSIAICCGSLPMCRSCL